MDTAEAKNPPAAASEKIIDVIRRDEREHQRLVNDIRKRLDTAQEYLDKSTPRGDST